MVYSLFIVFCLFSINNKGLHASMFSYKNPDEWGYTYPYCHGIHQSPINIDTRKAIYSAHLDCFMFKGYFTGHTPQNQYMLDIKNNGHTVHIDLQCDDCPTLSRGDLPCDTYVMEQLHFHWGHDHHQGSEHLIDGKAYPVEMHLVHYCDEFDSVGEAVASGVKDSVAVLGVMLEMSHKHNSNLDAIFESLYEVQHYGSDYAIPAFPLFNLLPKDVKHYYRYSGSLTTPTCNEIVVWTIFNDKVPISSYQLENLYHLMDAEGYYMESNHRPVQRMNGRQVFTNMPFFMRDTSDSNPVTANLLLFIITAACGIVSQITH